MAVTPTLNQSAIKENLDWIFREKEREFWEQAFCAALTGFCDNNTQEMMHLDAAHQADAALEEWRKRWAK